MRASASAELIGIRADFSPRARGHATTARRDAPTSSGVHYAGRYYAVMQDVPEQIYSGAWSGAQPYWPDWPIVSVKPKARSNWEAFAAAYTGQTIAHLESDDGRQSMRCRFTVNTPSAGLARGGEGECRLSDGSTIRKVVLAR